MLKIKEKVKAVIFDMDGTIIKNTDLWGEIVIKTLEAFNVSSQHFAEKRFDLERELVGVDVLSCAKILRKKFAEIYPFADEVVVDKILHFEKTLIHDIELMPGFHDFHKSLRDAGIVSCIATNAQKPYLSRMAEKFAFADIFGKHLYCIDDVNFIAKPSPTLFLHAAKQLGVSPDECIVFEDTMTGFLAAKGASMKCVAVVNSRNIHSHHMVHGKIDDYSQAINVLRELLILD